MNPQEFQSGLARLGLDNLSPQDAQAEFNKIDNNHGGQVLFVEFCAYIRKRVNPDANPGFDADIISGSNCSVHMRKSHGNKVTHTHFFTPKSFKDFDLLEAKIKSIMRSRKKMGDLWNRIDFNGNN